MRQRLITAIGFVVVVGLIVLIRNFGYLYFLENPIRLVTDSVLKKMYQISIPVDINQKQTEISQTACITEDTQLRLLQEENNNLRQQLQFFSKSQKKIGAEVIGRDLDPLGTTIIIDRGSADGLTNGHPVIVGNGLLIGKLVRVDEHTSVVRLLSDYQSRVAATVVNREKSLGLVEGGYGLTVKLDLIPQNEVIRPGDVIITSGLEAYIPRGLVIGTVEVVEKKTQEPFQQAIIKTAADLHSITLVSILL
jgi:rod shape-determining protein MreC